MAIIIRSLNGLEIESLLQQGCSSSLVIEDHHGFQQLTNYNSWDKVLVCCDEKPAGIDPTNLSWLQRIHRCRFHSFDSPLISQFVDELMGLGSITLNGVLISSSNKAVLSGAIILGRFSAQKISIAENIQIPFWFHGLDLDFPGLYDSVIEGDCWIGGHSLVMWSTLLRRCFLHSFSIIIRCTAVGSKGSVDCQRLEFSVGPESDVSHCSRQISASSKDSYAQVVKQAFSKQPLISEEEEVRTVSSTVIAAAILFNCVEVCNCIIGDPLLSTCSIVIDSCRISNCCIHVSSPGTVTLKQSTLQRCIIHSPCTVGDNCTLERALLFECSSVKDGAFVSNSVIGPDAGIAQGECHHSLLGPFVGFHHQSLLIATCWPLGRGNLGYGAMIGDLLFASAFDREVMGSHLRSIGANHTGRANDQECLAGEGCFFGLGAAVKFPFNCLLSPYSIFAAGIVCLPQRVAFPFSVICSPDTPLPAHLSPALCCIKPGWILGDNPYFLERSMQKFNSRRKAKEYRTNIPVFRPSIIDMVIDARERLRSVFSDSDVLTEKDVAGLGKCYASRRDLLAADRHYTDFIRRYALHGLLYQELLFLTSTDGDTYPVAAPAPESTVKRDPIESYILQDVNAMEFEASSSNRSLPAELVGVLLTDSYNPDVLRHQLDILQTEFPVDESVVHPPSAPFRTVVLLRSLLAIEELYARNVASCKKKDERRATAIIGEFAYRGATATATATATNENDDPVILSASGRKDTIKGLVDRILCSRYQ